MMLQVRSRELAQGKRAAHRRVFDRVFEICVICPAIGQLRPICWTSASSVERFRQDSGELLNRGVLVGKMHLLLDAASESALNGRDGKHIAKQK
jgi:hypothetical protein